MLKKEVTPILWPTNKIIHLPERQKSNIGINFYLQIDVSITSRMGKATFPKTINFNNAFEKLKAAGYVVEIFETMPHAIHLSTIQAGKKVALSIFRSGACTFIGNVSDAEFSKLLVNVWKTIVM